MNARSSSRTFHALITAGTSRTHVIFWWSVIDGWNGVRSRTPAENGGEGDVLPRAMASRHPARQHGHCSDLLNHEFMQVV